MTNAEWAVQEARIGPLRAQGYGRHAIARATGLHESTVGRRIRQGLPSARPAPAEAPDPARKAETAQIIRLHVEEGQNANRIACRLGVKRDVVEARLKQAGVYRPQPAGKLLPPLPEAMLPHVPHALNLARETLRRVAPPTTPEHNPDDWHSIARLAALKGLVTYRDERNCHWSSWVIQKVRWEISEELRRTSPYTRGEWRQLREESFAADPGLASSARRGEWEQQEQRLLADRRPSSLEQLREEQAGPEDLEERRWTWEPSAGSEPEAWLLTRAVRDALAALPARLRYVVERRQQEFTLLEIAGQMGLSESRINQLETEAHDRLRKALQAWA